MKHIYIVAMHADGYQVIKQGSSRGITTHNNILDALAECRVANRFVRDSLVVTEESVNEILSA